MHFPIQKLEFPTFAFLIFFLVVAGTYWALPRHRWRMTWLLFASCIFYMSFHPWLILLIVASASVDYIVALRLEHVTGLAKRRLLLACSIGVNLGLLGFFKYTNFLLGNANSLFCLFGVDYHWPLLENLYLPLGMSFYTFEAISYVVDVYQGRLKAVRSLLDYALYIMFFPHLAAGPIVRPRDFLPQLHRTKRFHEYRAVVGLLIFLVGLFKKAVIADHMAPIVDPIFADPGAWSSSAAWLGTLAYAVQIYCDFSGYSDMAMGLAHVLGFKLPVNFAMPYFALNITDFWRRWHISLSSWLRDYLYIPLGGSRGGAWVTYRNLMTTMLLGGLWHGASWTFVFWGGYHGLLLALHRAFASWRGERSADSGDQQPLALRFALRVPRAALSISVTFLCVCIGWVFFRAQSFGGAATVLARLAWPTHGRHLDLPSSVLVGVCVALVFAGHLVGSATDVRAVWRRWPAPALGSALAALLLLVLLFFPETRAGFIYFNF
ncbi:alginate O-acetyltransferase [Planctomycetaceae bacterium SCGC AG-212-F19]|nr:alginate O-acetyltransferase [Planctomycetaceae bacterium SCGC AG-212-F19]